MGYEKTNWQTGDIVTAAKLNKIENELEKISGPAPQIVWTWEGTIAQLLDTLTIRAISMENKYRGVSFFSTTEALFETANNEIMVYINGEKFYDTPATFSQEGEAIFGQKLPHAERITCGEHGTALWEVGFISGASSEEEVIEIVKQDWKNQFPTWENTLIKFVVQQHIKEEEEETPTEGGSSMFIIKTTDYDSDQGTWSKVNKTYEEIVTAINNGMVPILYLIDNGIIVYSFTGYNGHSVEFVNHSVSESTVVAKIVLIGQSEIYQRTVTFSKS